MKKLFCGLLVALSVFVASFAAQADEHDWEYGGEKIHFFRIEHPKAVFMFNLSDKRSIPADLVKKGLFVGALEGTTVYPKASEIVRQEFIRKGYKLVEKKEDAGAIVVFSCGGCTTFHLSDVEDDTPYPPNRINWDSQMIELQALMIFDPKVTEDGRMIAGVKDGRPENFDEFYYKRSTDSIKHATVFRMVIDEWIDFYVAKNGNPVE